MGLRRWVLSVIALIFLSQLSFAQSSDWAIVKQLSPGQKVKVMTADGKSHVGDVQSVADDAIRIGKNESIQMQEVRRVLLKGPGLRGHNTLIGLGVGAGTGLVLGIATGCDVHSTNNWCFVSRSEAVGILTPFFAGLGAGIGALLPAGGKWREVYRQQ